MSTHDTTSGSPASTAALEWFGLREDPFAERADARFYYPLPAHERIVDHCVRAVVNQSGMPLVYGPEGTGKSMLGARLVARFAEGVSGVSFRTHVIDGNVHRRSSTRALRELSLALGGTKSVPNYRLLDDVATRATALLNSGTYVVVMLEQAELFQEDMLWLVLSLWNLVTRDGSQFLTRLIAFGRPDYLRTLDTTKYANIRSRTVFGAPALKPFTPEELDAVLRHRVTVAGGEAGIVEAVAVQEIHRVTGGNPRLALAAAARALAAACAAGARSIGPDAVTGAEPVTG